MTRRTRHQLRCQCCGLLFPAALSSTMYCSNACRQDAYRKRRRTAALMVQPAAIDDQDDLPIDWREHQKVAALAPFAYQDHQLRVITDDQGVTWFVAVDVCDALDLGNHHQALTRLDDDEKGVSSIPTPGGHQSMTTVNEPGLYSLILGSRKPEAKAFKRWVTHEVLPAIRKTGSYSTTPAPTLPHGVHVVAKNHRHASWLLNLAVEQHVGAALMCKHVYDCQHHRTPSDIQFHIPAA